MYTETLKEGSMRPAAAMNKKKFSNSDTAEVLVTAANTKLNI